METAEIILIGVSLGMDAAAVSMTNGMVFSGVNRAKLLAMPVFFGGFQALMPLLGYLAGGLFFSLLNRYAGMVVLLILGTIGAKMIYDGFKCEKKPAAACPLFTYPVLLLQAVATSIDALAVGLGFGALKVHILPTVLIIGVTTGACSLAAIYIGKKFGDWLGPRAQILGGLLLIVLGIKALL